MDRLAELVQAGFEGLERRMDALEKGVKEHHEEFRSLRVEMGERFQSVDQRLQSVDQRFESVDQRFKSIDDRFQSVHDSFVTMDLRFDHVLSRIDHLATRQDILELTLRPIPEKLSALEASLTKAFHGLIKEIEPMHLQIFGVNQRLDHMADEMRQRFRALKAG